MKRIINFFIPVLLILAGCSVNEEYPPQPEGGAVGEMTFVINLPDPNQSPGSYAQLADKDENTVNSICVFAFKKDNNEYKLVEKVFGGTIKDVDGEGSRKKNFRVSFTKLILNESYQFVLLANGKSVIDNVSVNPGMTRDDVMNLFIMKNISHWVGAGEHMPMWGESADMNMTHGMTLSTIKLLRMVAKINVSVDPSIQTNFQLQDVRLYNYRTGGYIVPKRENLVDGSTEKVKLPTLYGNPVSSPPVEYNNSGGEENVKETDCTNYIYTFETDQPSDGDFSKMPALVIGAKYNRKATSYYRINFSKTDGSVPTYLDLLRNHRYEINIKEVKGNGYETPEEAFNSKGINVEAEIIEWNDGNVGDVHFDGQYYLTFDPGTAFSFDKPATSQIVSITTDYPSGWKVNKIAEEISADNEVVNPSWLSVDKTSGAYNTKVAMKISLTTNTSGNVRKGLIYVTAGLTTVKISVTQTPTVEPILVTNVVVMPDSLQLYVGYTSQLKAVVLPANATNQQITWTSLKSSVATVDVDGNVVPVSAGTAMIVARTVDGSNKFAYSIVTVGEGFWPKKHRGWAGCNIYYDSNLGRLTFDDSDDSSRRLYQGVFFKWGSLVGISPIASYTTNTKLFKPTGGTMEGLAYEDIPYISSDLKLPGSQDDRAYLYEVTDESKSIGDICKYLTDKGWAPGSSQGTKWRMPTANESRIVKYLMRVGTWGKRYEAENIDGTSVDPNTCYLNREGVHFPVSGYLNKDGDMGTQYPGVAYGSWTSTGNAARSTFWLSNSFLLHDVYDHYRSAAAIIRCVKE